MEPKEEKKDQRSILFSWWFWAVVFIVLVLIFMLVASLRKKPEEKEGPDEITLPPGFQIPAEPPKDEGGTYTPPPQKEIRPEDLPKIQKEIEEFKKKFEEETKNLPIPQPPGPPPPLPPLP